MQNYIDKHYKTLFTVAIIVLGAPIVLMHRMSIDSVKGLIMTAVLIKASFDDIKTRQVEDNISVCLLITGCIGISSLFSLIDGILGFLIVFIPFFIYLMFHPKGGFGGADIKICASLTFIFGIISGLICIVLGLLLAVICTSVMAAAEKHRAKKNGTVLSEVRLMKRDFPVIPYLTVAAAFLFAFT